MLALLTTAKCECCLTSQASHKLPSQQAGRRVSMCDFHLCRAAQRRRAAVTTSRSSGQSSTVAVLLTAAAVAGWLWWRKRKEAEEQNPKKHQGKVRNSWLAVHNSNQTCNSHTSTPRFSVMLAFVQQHLQHTAFRCLHNPCTLECMHAPSSLSALHFQHYY